jgi:hypothetical protein
LGAIHSCGEYVDPHATVCESAGHVDALHVIPLGRGQQLLVDLVDAGDDFRKVVN